MSRKQAISVGIIVLILTVAFGLLYSQFSVQAPSGSDDSLKSGMSTSAPKNTMDSAVSVPETPDAVVDSILSDASSDESLLKDAALDEQSSVSESADALNNLTQTYDENQL